MLNEEQVAILTDISQSVAFDDGRQGKADQLVIEGYVAKNGDLYELTSKGQQVVIEHGATLNDP